MKPDDTGLTTLLHWLYINRASSGD